MNSTSARMIYRAAALLRGEKTFRYRAMYEESQRYTLVQIERNQNNAIASVIDFLQINVPYYTDLEISVFEQLPIISKSMIKADADLFRANPVSKRTTRKTTGGSTGQPVTIYKDAEAMAREQAATMRGYSWAGLTPGDKQYRMWGAPIRQFARANERIRDILLNRRRFSAFNYTESDFKKLFIDFCRFRPAYIYGYVSIIRDFANYITATNSSVSFPWFKCVITTSEILTPGDRKKIETAFGVRVFNEYGCGEVGTIAHECEAGNMHINSENLIVETVDEKGFTTSGDGRLVLTELYNRAQPLIRYDVGDYGTIDQEHCNCGRQLPVLRNIHGRAYDVILGPENQRYHPEFFIYIMEEINRNRDAINQFQVIQENRMLTFRMVPGSSFGDDVQSQISDRIMREFGGYFQVCFKEVDRIEREPSGKQRVVKRLQPKDLPR